MYNKLQALQDTRKFTKQMEAEVERYKNLAILSYNAEVTRAKDYASSHEFYVNVANVMNEAIADLKRKKGNKKNLHTLETFIQTDVTSIPVKIDSIRVCCGSRGRTHGWSIKFTMAGHRYVLEVPRYDRIDSLCYDLMNNAQIYIGRYDTDSSALKCIECTYVPKDCKKHFKKLKATI